MKRIFPRKLRLLTSVHFNFVFQQPQRASVLQMIILGRLNQLGYPRIGLTVAKKHVRHAYQRNRIKRVARESFRLNQHKLPSMDFIFLVKKGAAELDNHTLMETLEKLWRCHCRQAPCIS